MEDVTTVESLANNQEGTWRPQLFHIWLFCSLILIVALLSLPRIQFGKHHHVEFNLGLVPIGIAIFFTMVVGALVRKKTLYFSITIFMALKKHNFLAKYLIRLKVNCSCAKYKVCFCSLCL